MHFSFLHRDLPPAILMFCFLTDATGRYPGGVWDSSLLYVTARPATKAPVTTLLLTGSSLHGGPKWSEPPTTHVSQPLLHLVRLLRASLALYGW